LAAGRWSGKLDVLEYAHRLDQPIRFSVGFNRRRATVDWTFVLGTKISVVARTSGDIDAFACAIDGQMYGSYWKRADGWRKVDDHWLPVGGTIPLGSTFHAGSVTAIAREREKRGLVHVWQCIRC
jgi:hypothetical protein